MFPGLHATDVTELPQLAGALTDALGRHGPSVISIECSADEIPTFAPFLDSATQQTQKESPQHVAARA